ncbi:MAG: hypothetical protein AAF492_18815, partial [Verrucomicrobiota bacterium]
MAFLSVVPSQADVVLTENFESPDINGYTGALPPGWIGASVGFGATDRGLFDEGVTWPAPVLFTTTFDEQGFRLNYTNSGLTTRQNLIAGVLTANQTYTVSFNVAKLSNASSASWKVELV